MSIGAPGFAGAAKANRVILETELGASLPAVVADRVQVQQVVVNLMRNGIEAMNSSADQPQGIRLGRRL